MSDEKEEVNNIFTEKGETKVKSENITEGELSCVIVYSDRKHVNYINSVISFFESVLKKDGFRPQRLGDEIRSTEDFLEKLEKLIDNCVLGIIILDGFRPNVIFEFGLLKGRKKPIIVLQSVNASINIKTLFESYEEAGLSEKKFKLMKDPLIKISNHLSDFGGKYIAYFDWGAMESENKHPSVVLENELKKNKDQVTKEKLKMLQ
ncbi:MAG: hypothetical protein O8C61_07760 [Candidatus Methanoperedens sp.]|nr:hypothetical protein [Candidatus Methanoperedens sp.]